MQTDVFCFKHLAGREVDLGVSNMTHELVRQDWSPPKTRVHTPPDTELP